MRYILMATGFATFLLAAVWNKQVFIASTAYTPMIEAGRSAFWGGGRGIVIIWRSKTHLLVGYDGNVGWRFSAAISQT